MGSVETLIVWENLETQRITLKNHGSEGLENFYCCIGCYILQK